MRMEIFIGVFDMDIETRKKYFTKLLKTTEPYSFKDIYYKGQKRKLPVFQIDLDFLIYNQYNGRIASFVKSYNKEQGIELDASKPKDAKVIEKFLWESSESANKATQKSIASQGQNEYGIVTKDGVIIDGNRRSMLLRRDGQEKKESPIYFLGVVLEEFLDDAPKEIMRLETTYQMGEDAKVDYSAIEKYLKCKDLIDYNFTTKEIAKMMGDSESKVKDYLSIMELMDDYLSKLGYAGIYTRLDKTEGAFVDLYNYLTRYEGKKSAMVQWDYEEDDLLELKLIYFDYIRGIYNRGKQTDSGSGDSKDYRFIGQTSKKGSFFSNKSVWDKFKDSHFENIESITLAEPDIEKDRADNPGMSLDSLFKQRDVRWAKKADPFLKKGIGLALESLNNITQQNAPLELLAGAIAKLEAVNIESKPFLEDEEVYALVREINSLTYDFTNMIKNYKKQKQ